MDVNILFLNIQGRSTNSLPDRHPQLGKVYQFEINYFTIQSFFDLALVSYNYIFRAAPKLAESANGFLSNMNRLILLFVYIVKAIKSWGLEN